MVRALAILGLVLAACGGRADAGSPSTLDSSVPAAPAAGCADVTGAEVVAEDGGTHRFDVTVRPADTGWDKYADAWEVQAPDGTVLGGCWLIPMSTSNPSLAASPA